MQGNVREHIRMLEKCGVAALEVKAVADLDRIDGLIIPGGESTTIGKLMLRYGFIEAVRSFYKQGKPVFGTCAGMILIAKSVVEGEQPLLELMDITVRRNAFGRQIDSCETDLDIPILGKDKFKAVFIRAPWVENVGTGVAVLAEFQEHPVMVREGGLLATAFHPEMCDDTRVHEYFLSMVKEQGS